MKNQTRFVVVALMMFAGCRSSVDTAQVSSEQSLIDNHAILHPLIEDIAGLASLDSENEPEDIDGKLEQDSRKLVKVALDFAMANQGNLKHSQDVLDSADTFEKEANKTIRALHGENSSTLEQIHYGVLRLRVSTRIAVARALSAKRSGNNNSFARIANAKKQFLPAQIKALYALTESSGVSDVEKERYQVELEIIEAQTYALCAFARSLRYHPWGLNQGIKTGQVTDDFMSPWFISVQEGLIVKGTALSAMLKTEGLTEVAAIRLKDLKNKVDALGSAIDEAEIELAITADMAK